MRQTQTKPTKVNRNINFKITNDIECSMATRGWDREWGNIRGWPLRTLKHEKEPVWEGRKETVTKELLAWTGSV